MKTLVMIVLMAGAAIAHAGTLPINSFKATSDGNNVTVHWATTDESAVKEFGIERCPVNGSEFVLIATVAPKGNYAVYDYIDRTAFKSTGTLYQYRIKVVFANSTVDYSVVTETIHSTWVGKRTWGSLKAMFR